MRTALVYCIVLSAAAAALFLGFPELFGEPVQVNASNESGANREVPPVVVARVENAPFADSLQALGTVMANESVVLTPNRADHVAVLHFDDGQQVLKGDLLVEMQAKEEKAMLAEAQAVRDDREISLKRAKELYDKNLMSAREYESTQALLAASQARVLGLQAAIADRLVYAPFTGVLGLRRVSVGAYVQPSTVLATLDDLSVVKLDFTIPESWLPIVQKGMKIAARTDAWPKDEFDGEVSTIDTRLDPRTRSATVRAKLPNPKMHLRPGMLLKVRIDRGSQDVLQVPEEALIPVGEDHFVFRVGADDMAERVQVQIGRRRVGAVEILAGLAAGERVVVEGILRVRDGAPVKVVKTVTIKG